MGSIILILILGFFTVCIYYVCKVIYIHHLKNQSTRRIRLRTMSSLTKKVYLFIYGEVDFIPSSSNTTGERRNTAINSSTLVRNTSSPVRQNIIESMNNVNTNFNESGEIIYFANDNHGSFDKLYKFNYVKHDNYWRAYIIRMPSLNMRNTSQAITHRLHDPDRGDYVCWDTPINNIRDMINVSKLWADCIQEYIATGKTFG